MFACYQIFRYPNKITNTAIRIEEHKKVPIAGLFSLLFFFLNINFKRENKQKYSSHMQEKIVLAHHIYFSPIASVFSGLI